MAYKRYTQLPVLLDMLAQRRLTVLGPWTWVDRNDTYFLEQYARRMGIPGVLTLCLTDAAGTYHHWRVYAGGDLSAVRIDFHEKAFTEWVSKTAPEARIAKVKYFRLKERDAIRIPDDLPFAKRHAFRDEGEVRLVVPKTQSAQRVRHLQNMPLSVIKAVTLSPWLPASLFDAVRNAIRGVAGEPGVRVQATSLLANERFQGTADGHADGQED